MSQFLRNEFLLLVVAAFVPVLSGGEPVSAKYKYVEVNRFEASPGVDLPVDYQIAIVEDIARHLGETKEIEKVLRAGEPAPTDSAVLRITGKFTKFSKGSQAARYLVGFGAGATVVVADVQFIDSASGKVLLERKVDGKVVMGVIGGKSSGATNGLAKEVVKVVRQKFV